jgi:hypothetical protein
MPEPRNYRFADEIEVGSLWQATTGTSSPTSPEGAAGSAILDIGAEELKGKKATQEAIGGILEQSKKLADNKQKLISTIIKPMKGLDDTAAPGQTSPAEIYADKIIFDITSASSIPRDAAIAMILEVWPVWQQHGNTWDTFIQFIAQAAVVFKNPSDVIEWSKKLFESMQDGAPVFTPEYIMSVALDAINSKNFTKYQNLLISLPFYKAVWSKQPIDPKDFSKAVSQIGTLMEAIRTPTEKMKTVLENIEAQNELVTACYLFYDEMIKWVQEVNIQELKKAKQQMQLKGFDASDEFAWWIRVEAHKKALRETVGAALKGLNAYGTEVKKVKSNTNKLFKTVLAGPTAPASTTGAGSSTSTSTTSTTSTSASLTAEQQNALRDANSIIRRSALIETRQQIIDNNLSQINNISEQKAKGLSGDNLGLYSSFVTSGNVIEKIDKTIVLIKDQFKDIDFVIITSENWVNTHRVEPNEPDAIASKRDTIELNRMKYRTLKEKLNEISNSLKIQKIVLPKELEYFELKQDYDTNIEQLKAPVSALMVNTLVTTKNNKGRLITVNKRVVRPVAIKNVWETGKKIVALLMKISQALQAGTNNSSLGQSMLKNATNYYKAAIKQEVENNKMLMDNLANVGLGGQVNYTPVAVGKK